MEKEIRAGELANKIKAIVESKKKERHESAKPAEAEGFADEPGIVKNIREDDGRIDAIHCFLDFILITCFISEIDGRFKCKRCDSDVRIDWFDKEVECLGGDCI